MQPIQCLVSQKFGMDLKVLMGKHNLLLFKINVRNSLAVQWLGLSAYTATTQVQFLAGELRSHKLSDSVKKQTNKKSCGHNLILKLPICNLWSPPSLPALHFTDDRAEAQRGLVTCPGLHRSLLGKPWVQEACLVLLA